MGHVGGVNVASLAAMEQSRMLANTLAQNNDPKFQVCNLCHNFNVSLRLLKIVFMCFIILYFPEILFPTSF